MYCSLIVFQVYAVTTSLPVPIQMSLGERYVLGSTLLKPVHQLAWLQTQHAQHSILHHLETKGATFSPLPLANMLPQEMLPITRETSDAMELLLVSLQRYKWDRLS